MINNVFCKIKYDIGKSLFADDAALWKNGKSLTLIQEKMQEIVRLIEEWSYSWGFKFSVEKTKMMVFTRKRVKDARILMYGKLIKQVNSFRFLGVKFDYKLNWTEHVRKVEEKCKKILNMMRFLTGSEWGASIRALRDVYVA